MSIVSLAKTAQARKPATLYYAGDVTPQEAWEVLSSDSAATLVDVRTQPEWAFTGLPDLSAIGKKTIKISWKLYPTMEVNQRFAEQIAGEGIKTDAPIFFLCKTGGRSLDAACAMTELGHKYCFNVMHGFEGDADANRHRGTVNGWKAANLPWAQG